MLSYWIWLTVFVFLPILVVSIWKRDLLKRYKKTILMSGIGCLVVAVPWDYFAIEHQLWWFPTDEILGLWFLGLPIEEWCFIFFIGIEITIMALVFRGEGNV